MEAKQKANAEEEAKKLAKAGHQGEFVGLADHQKMMGIAEAVADLARKRIREAEIKNAGLTSEVEELKAEVATLKATDTGAPLTSIN